MNRKNIIILVAIIVLGLLGGAGYWYFSHKTNLPVGDNQFPGGATSGTGGTQVVPGTSTEETPPLTELPRLYELHKAPVAGAGFAETKDKKGNVTGATVRYIEKSLGNIFEASLATYKESRIVNETRPRIAEALWGNNGNSVVVRFIDDKTPGVIQSRIITIETPSVSMAKSTSTETISGEFFKTEEVFLPDNIPFMSTALDGSNTLFYLEGGVGSTATFKDTGVTKIFSSAFTEWLPQFPNQKMIFLTTKPSANVPGHMFALDPKTKTATRVLGGINGLTTLTSPDGKFILFSETKFGGPELSFYDIEEQKAYSLEIKTLPEKCVWGRKNPKSIYCAVPKNIPSGAYPDQWYQGVISFSDELWQIDTKTLLANKIMSPETYNAPALDIINPVISFNDEYLLFINKSAGTPWLYSIVEHLPPSLSASEATPSSSALATQAVPPSVVTPDMQKLK